MPRRYRTGGRRPRGSLARRAAPFAIPVALAVAVGAIVVIVDHSGANTVSDAANAHCASPAAYVMPANAAGYGHHGPGSPASPTAVASSAAAPPAGASGTSSPTAVASTTATATASSSGTASPTAVSSTTAPATAAPTT